MSQYHRVAPAAPRKGKLASSIKPAAPIGGFRKQVPEQGLFLASITRLTEVVNLLLAVAVDGITTCCETAEEVEQANYWLIQQEWMRVQRIPVGSRRRAFLHCAPDYRRLLEYRKHPVVHALIILMADEYRRWRNENCVPEKPDPEEDRAGMIFRRESFDENDFVYDEATDRIVRVYHHDDYER